MKNGLLIRGVRGLWRRLHRKWVRGPSGGDSHSFADCVPFTCLSIRQRLAFRNSVSARIGASHAQLFNKLLPFLVAAIGAMVRTHCSAAPI